jgi:hypothetical protein
MQADHVFSVRVSSLNHLLERMQRERKDHVYVCNAALTRTAINITG